MYICTDDLREAIGPLGSYCFSRGSVPEYLRKHIDTCILSKGIGGWWSGPPVCPYGSAYDLIL